MKKYLFILALALICFSCSQENEFDGGNPSLKGFQVNADFIDLSVGSSNEQVGAIKVTSDEDEVKVKWISDPSFNIDTTQTSILMKNGQGILPIKWQGKLENGAYAPSNILFKAGVVISSGDEEKYIPLYHVQNLDSAKVMENMQTRNTAAEPRISSIEFIPAAPVMGENGATLLVRLTNVEQAIVDYSNIKSSHNIDVNETDLPTVLSTAQSVLRFKWKDDSVRPAAFALPIMFYAFELVNPVSFTLVWNPEEPAIAVNPAQHSVAYTGGTAVSQITSNSSWVVNKGSESWFTMTPTSGNGNGSITFTVSPNAGEARSATVTVVSGNISKEIVINQVAKEVELAVEPASHSVTNAGGTVTSTITSNTSWTATKGSEDWFTMTPASGSGNGSIAFTVSPNNSISTRTATVTVTSGSITKQITITQAGQDISLSVNPASHSVANTGGIVTSTITSNAAWTATKGSESWFTMTPANGNGNGEIKFTVAANTSFEARSAKVTVKAGDIIKEITITQSALVASLVVKPTSYSVASAGGIVLSSITSNTSWKVTISDSWLHANALSGTNNGILAFTVDANNTINSRTATVTITSTGGSTPITRNITVTQVGLTPVLTVSPTSFPNIQSTGQSVNVSITSNVSWNITTSASWLHVNKASGNGNASVAFTVDANSATTSRTATATITTSAAGITPITRTIVFTQSEGAKPVNPGGITVDDIGESENIIINGGSL